MSIKLFMTALLCLACSHTAWAQSTETHTGHGGGSSESSCIKARISHYNPEHLASVAPGAAFSFIVAGSNGPGHIHVSIRQEPVALTVEDKETFYLVKGNLPANIKNETIRLSIKAKAKVGKCDADSGILLKVGG